jgi:hypothetical protein
LKNIYTKGLLLKKVGALGAKSKMAKISPNEADYRPQTKQEHCEDCTMYRAPNKCTLVLGYINPRGHCRYFKAKNKLPTGDK